MSDIRSVLEDTLELVRLGGYNDCILANNLQTIGNYRLNVKAMTVDEALQAIREIALGCAPEKKDEHPTDFDGRAVETYGYEVEYNSAVDLYTERLRAAFGDKQ